jgi:hypothetical protein
MALFTLNKLFAEGISVPPKLMLEILNEEQQQQQQERRRKRDDNDYDDNDDEHNDIQKPRKQPKTVRRCINSAF